MIVEVRAEAPFYKNGFVVGCERTREGIIIDPGDEVDGLLAAVRDHDLDIRYILLTHAHLDHVSGVRAAKDALGAPVYLHKDDLFLYDAVPQQGAMFGYKVQQPPPVDEFYDMTGGPDPPLPIGFGEASKVRPTATLRFGEYEVRVHHTPGHCPGGVCLQIGKTGTDGQELFVGDTLFAGGIGRTDLPGGNYETLMRSIAEVLFPLGDTAIVHSGHGPDTTIGRERTTNPFVLEYLRNKP